MKLVIATALALASIAVVPVGAQTVRATKVFYGDLDLGNAAGLSTLKNRIDRAAHAVCDQHGNDIELASRTASRDCYRVAIIGANKQIPATVAQFASR